MTTRLRRLAGSSLAVAAVAAGLALPSAAMPATVLDTCINDLSTNIMTNAVADAGCVRVTIVSPGVMRLLSVEVMPGWTYTVANAGGGTNSRVDVRFANAATKAKWTFKAEFGRTVIR